MDLGEMGSGEWAWILVVGGGTLLLGIALAYGWAQWRTEAKNRTPGQQRKLEEETRKNFGKVEDPVGGQPKRK